MVNGDRWVVLFSAMGGLWTVDTKGGLYESRTEAGECAVADAKETPYWHAVMRIGDAEPCAYFRPGTGEKVEP